MYIIVAIGLVKLISNLLKNLMKNNYAVPWAIEMIGETKEKFELEVL